MTTTENSRADALTVPTISREAFYAIVRTALMWYRSDNPSRYLNDEQVDANDAEFVGKLADEHAKILAASPVEQRSSADRRPWAAGRLRPAALPDRAAQDVERHRSAAMDR
ncbi:hypothetical protein [Burkholderia cepacia]|uniref:hypothetical protein n=1 Tax=Burkholderia cepacia TaxID=292 RepID=UPI001F31AA78|nr:hypothetical protein [Burkholderia cepacia]UIY58157.1 hypothetical protein LZ568_08060 [Burkholderia cepacia]